MERHKTNGNRPELRRDCDMRTLPLDRVPGVVWNIDPIRGDCDYSSFLNPTAYSYEFETSTRLEGIATKEACFQKSASFSLRHSILKFLTCGGSASRFQGGMGRSKVLRIDDNFKIDLKKKA